MFAGPSGGPGLSGSPTPGQVWGWVRGTGLGWVQGQVWGWGAPEKGVLQVWALHLSPSLTDPTDGIACSLGFPRDVVASASLCSWEGGSMAISQVAEGRRRVLAQSVWDSPFALCAPQWVWEPVETACWLPLGIGRSVSRLICASVLPCSGRP